jgi:outer membrane protein
MKLNSKLTIKLILSALLVSCLAGMTAKAEVRVASINLQKVFDGYWKRGQKQTTLDQKKAAFDKDEKTMVADFEKTKGEYDNLVSLANDTSVTQDERNKRKAAAESKLLELKTAQNSIQTFEESSREQLMTEIRSMRNSIVDDITTAVKAKAQAAGYTMVIDSAAETASGTPVFIYNNGENDLTDAILTQLNATAPPTNSAPAAPDANTKTVPSLNDLKAK